MAEVYKNKTRGVKKIQFSLYVMRAPAGLCSNITYVFSITTIPTSLKSYSSLSLQPVFTINFLSDGKGIADI